MSLSQREQQILAELESQFPPTAGLPVHARARAKTARAIRHLGWAVIVIGFVVMLTTVTVSVAVSFSGAVTIALGVYAVQRWSGVPPVMQRLRAARAAPADDAS